MIVNFNHVLFKLSHIHVLRLKDKISDFAAQNRDFQQCGICDQQRLRPACTYTQSDQSLC